MQIHTNKFALVLGTFAAVMHLIWGIIVGLGWGQPLVNFVHSMHFMNTTIIIDQFNIGRAIGLIVLAFCVAYIVGYIFSTIWNKIYKM